MKVICSPNKLYPEFEVYEENKLVIHAKIDIETRAFRIRYKDNRRVFFIENEVIKKSEVTTLLNEYSQQLGFLTKSKSNTDMGEIEIEGARYIYKLNNDFSKEIHLFEDINYEPILSCTVEMGQLSFIDDSYISYLLFALVWFIFLSKEEATFAPFAEA